MVDNLCHNPYFSRWFSAIRLTRAERRSLYSVTILILVDGFLQFRVGDNDLSPFYSHNPYFSRWFSAIDL